LTARFTRQVRLAEVGAVGQARLEATVAHLASPDVGCARAVETTYLEGAGVKVATPPSGSSLSADWLEELHPSAREVATGAYAALMTMRRALGMS
jgi:hypothetical protein